MAGTSLNVLCSEVDRDGSRIKITNAWIYWRTASKNLILRADGNGTVLQFTAGDPKSPASYQQEFVAQAGDQVNVAYNIEPTQLGEQDIAARLAPFTVKESLAAALAGIGKVNVAGKGKTVVTVLPKAEIKLQKYHPFMRAVAATQFGGFPSDVHVRNMDRFLTLNYGSPGAAPKAFRGTEPRGFREELRRVVRASGPGPLDIIHDIGTAAKAVANDDAGTRVVAVLAHSNNQVIGRQLRGDFILDPLTLDQLRELVPLKADFDLKNAALKRAQDRLAQARASKDPGAIQAAEEEADSRQKDLETLDPAALAMLQAFAQAAQALEQSQVDVVELQSCGTAAKATTIATFDFLSRLGSFLSTRTHSVQVKGHAKAIYSQPAGGAGNPVRVWVGGPDPKIEAEQVSTTSLPLP